MNDRGYDVGQRVVRILMKLFGIRLINKAKKPPQSEARKFLNSKGNGLNILYFCAFSGSLSLGRFPNQGKNYSEIGKPPTHGIYRDFKKSNKRKVQKYRNIVKKLKTIKPLQVFYTDYTEINYANGRKKAYLMPILDHKSKLVAGWALEKDKDTHGALKAIDRAKSTIKELGIALKDKFIHHDQDPV